MVCRTICLIGKNHIYLNKTKIKMYNKLIIIIKLLKQQLFFYKNLTYTLLIKYHYYFIVIYEYLFEKILNWVIKNVFF